jgi:hypothetical protein
MKTYTLRDARRIVAKAERSGSITHAILRQDYCSDKVGVMASKYAIHVPVSRAVDCAERGYIEPMSTLREAAAWLDEQIRREGGSSPAILAAEEDDNEESPEDENEGGEEGTQQSVTSEGSGGPGSMNLDSTSGRFNPQGCGDADSKGAKASGSRSSSNAAGTGAGMSASSTRTETEGTSPGTGESTSQSRQATGNPDFTPHHADKAEGSQMRENVVACGSGTAERDGDKSWPNFNLTTPGGDLTGVISQDLPHSDGQYSHSANGGRAGSVIDERAVTDAAGAHKASAVKLSAALDSLFKRLQEVGNGLEQSPRIDSSRLARELLTKTVRMSPTRKDELSRRLTVITVDVSPSCAAIASTATAAGIALCKSDSSVVLITHSNGYIESISGQRVAELNMPMGIEGYSSEVRAQWSRFTADKVAGIVAWGDWDAIEYYAIAAENVPVFWLDPQKDRGDLPTKTYGDSYPGLHKVKTYIRGVDSPEKAPIALGKCKF